MATPDRPLSPHLQVYRWQITMVMSILHRITGVFLAFGAFGLAACLLALSSPSDPHDPAGSAFSFIPQCILNFLDSALGAILIVALVVALVWSLIYHFLNGIRHLFWDAGKGFEVRQSAASGWSVVILSIVLTVGLLFLSITLDGRG